MLRCTAPQSPLDCVSAGFESLIASEARIRATRLMSRSPSPTSPVESTRASSFRRQQMGSARFDTTTTMTSSRGGHEEPEASTSTTELQSTAGSSMLTLNAGVAMEWSPDAATSRDMAPVVSCTTEPACREHSVSFAASNSEPFPRIPRLESSRSFLFRSSEHRHSSVCSGSAPQFPTASTELVRIASARRRVVEHRTSVVDLSNKLANDESFKQMVAAERKHLLAQQGTLRRVMCWEILIILRRVNWLFVSKTIHTRLHHTLWQKMNLKIACWIRRPLRRARLRLMTAAHPPSPPTVAELRKDRILDLFSDGCLRHVSAQLLLRYYFPNETVIFMSCRDTEAYVLVSGTADVMVRQTKVFTILPGGIFGVVGMVSGEPRTATVVARGHTVVWCFNRQTFESYESPDDDVTANARHLIAEMRATNFQNAYHSLLEISSMQYFRLFQGVGRDFLSALSTRGTPKVVPCGSALYSKDTNIPGELGNAACVVLRGTVRVFVHEAFVNHHTTNPTTMCEAISKVVQLREAPAGRSLAGSLEHHVVQQFFSHRSAIEMGDQAIDSAGKRLTSKASKDALHSVSSVPSGFVPVVDLPSPTLVNFVGVLQPQDSAANVFVIAREELDILVWSREFIFRQDVIELAEVRKRCNAVQLEWLPRLTSSRLCRTLVRSCSGLASIPSLKPAKLKPTLGDTVDRVLFACCERGSLERDEFVTYAKDSPERCALLIMDGAVQYTATARGTSSSITVSVTQCGEKTASQLWPSVSQIVSADADVVAKVTSPRVLFYKLRRIHLLQWLSCTLSPRDIPAFMSILVQESLERVSSRKPPNATAPAFRPLMSSEWNAAVPIDTATTAQVSALETAFVDAAMAVEAAIAPREKSTSTVASAVRSAAAPPLRSRSDLSRGSMLVAPSSSGTQLPVGASTSVSSVAQNEHKILETHSPQSPLSAAGSPTMSLAIPAAVARFDSAGGSPLLMVPGASDDAAFGGAGSSNFTPPNESNFLNTHDKGVAESRSPGVVGNSTGASPHEFCRTQETPYATRANEQGASPLATPMVAQDGATPSKCLPHAARPPPLSSATCLVERDVAAPTRGNVQQHLSRTGPASACLRNRDPSLPARYGVHGSAALAQRVVAQSAPWTVSTSALRPSYHDRALRVALNRHVQQPQQ